MTFKIGDRVRYFGPGAPGDKTDFGTIVSRDNHRVGFGGWIGIMENACLHKIYILN